jgi:CBS domain-containing protein
MNIMNFAVRDVVTVAPGDSIDKAISLMEERAIHHLVVQSPDGRVEGVLSDRDVLISTGWMLTSERRSPRGAGTAIVGPTRIGEVMSRATVTLSAAEAAVSAARAFLNHRISAAPVLHNGKLVGIITERDLMKWLDALGSEGTVVNQILGAPVHTLMRSHVIRVQPETPIIEIVDLFRRWRIRHVPVCSDGRLVGIISDRDVRRCLGWGSIRDQENESRADIVGPQAAHEIMRHPVLTVGVDEPLRAALRKMLEFSVHSLVAERDQEVLGIITQTDFIKAIVREKLL